MKTIFIIGGGQLGSRHLQGASKVNIPTNIYVMDPSEESLEVAKQRFEQTHNGKHTLQLTTSMNDLPDHADVVIISTNSKPRLAILEDLLAKSTVKFLILEKVLFSRLDEYEKAKELLAKHNVSAYVNCVRRGFPDYIALKKRLGKLSALNMVVEMPGFFIASNGIHISDLFSYLLDDPEDITFDVSGIDKTLVEAKREGYDEINGELICRSGNNTLRIRNIAKGSISQTIYVTTDRHRITVQETHKPAMTYAGEDTDWKIELQSFVMPFQSAATTDLIETFINQGECNLPTYEVASRQHVAMLSELENHFKSTLNIT
jgi:predicted dehydrogenase